MIETLYLCLGIIVAAIGVIGIFVPIIPTVPFLLLSVFFISKTNKSYEQVILENKVVGTIIQNYMKNRTMKKSSKIKSISFLWIGILVSILLVDDQKLFIVLMLVGIGVSVHLMFLPVD